MDSIDQIDQIDQMAIVRQDRCGFPHKSVFTFQTNPDLHSIGLASTEVSSIGGT